MDKMKLIYDVKSMPDNLNLEHIYNIMENSGIVVYDSALKGDKPVIIGDNDLTVMDVHFYTIKDIEERFGNLK